MEIRQSPEWGKFLESLGWRTEMLDGCVLRIKKLGPLGSIIKIQRPENLPLTDIDRLAKKHKALFVKLEPLNKNKELRIKNFGFIKDTWPLTPTRTVFIDLNKTETWLLKSFSKDTRQTLRKINDSKLTIQEFGFKEMSEENEIALKRFYEIWKETAKRGRFWLPAYRELLSKVQAFGANATLLLAVAGDVKSQSPFRAKGGMAFAPLAGCLLLFCDDVAYYHHAASTLDGQKQETPYTVLWTAILESQKRGMKKLDLEGIFDPRFPTMFRKWVNFSTFKLKWGGGVFEYPGTFTKTYHPLIRLLFKIQN